MKKSGESEKFEMVNIRPDVSVLSVLRHLNYQPWFAIAEFVDNSIQSATKNYELLQELHKGNYELKVHIYNDAESGRSIVIEDNAGGISQSEYPIAFRPATIPSDASGLSEFGMGMKSAACWFSSNWSVQTSAIGEDVTRTVKFDVEKIVKDGHGNLEVVEKPALKNEHFTKVILEDVHQSLASRKIGKIKDHLTDIYREFIRSNKLILLYNDVQLEYNEPNILFAVDVRKKNEEKMHWFKDINFDFGNGLSAKGFAALRDPGNTTKCGFALFRRGRLIQGSGDQGYRPQSIFGSPNSFRSQRLFGELHLEGFDVSHTKDGFKWDENEDAFLDLLKVELDSDELPLLNQAEGYRALVARPQLKRAAEKAVQSTTDAMEKSLAISLSEISENLHVETSTEPLADNELIAERRFEVEFRNQRWTIIVELSDELDEDDQIQPTWLDISSSRAEDEELNIIQMRLSLTHPFMVRFAQANSEMVDALLRIAASLALAEVLARLSGQKYTGTIRSYFNSVLLKVLSDA